MGTGQDLYQRAKKLIPGGTQLLSKRPEMFLPDRWPAYYSRARGAAVWDLDGRRYEDVCYMGIGACVLGYADPDVNRAVARALRDGNMTTLNSPEEVALAEKLVELHPWAARVRFTRTGGEAMTVALRIARARSGRSTVLFSGYHGWHDWYLSANLADDQALDGQLLPGLQPSGVPRSLRGTSVPFRYNDVESLRRLLSKHDDVGVITLEAIRNEPPSPEFVEVVNAASRDRSVIVVVDEITSGWRLNHGGAHLLHGLKPAIAVFAKGMSNGIPMAAVIGTADAMDVAQTTFISSTYWTERLGPVAALATIKKMEERNGPEHLVRIGSSVQQGWTRAARSAGIEIEVGGIAPLGHFAFRGTAPLACKTLYTQEMLKRGFLASTAFYVSLAHEDRLVARYLEATEQVFRIIKGAQDSGSVERLLEGPVCHGGFSRLT